MILAPATNKPNNATVIVTVFWMYILMLITYGILNSWRRREVAE